MSEQQKRLLVDELREQLSYAIGNTNLEKPFTAFVTEQLTVKPATGSDNVTRIESELAVRIVFSSYCTLFIVQRVRDALWANVKLLKPSSIEFDMLLGTLTVRY